MPVRTLAAITFVGGIVGSVLLVLTPSRAFDVIIPWLLLVGLVVMLFGRSASEWLHERVSIGRPTLVAAQSLLAIYGGYFGGGVGLMLTAHADDPSAHLGPCCGCDHVSRRLAPLRGAGDEPGRSGSLFRGGWRGCADVERGRPMARGGRAAHRDFRASFIADERIELRDLVLRTPAKPSDQRSRSYSCGPQWIAAGLGRRPHDIRAAALHGTVGAGRDVRACRNAALGLCARGLSLGATPWQSARQAKRRLQRMSLIGRFIDQILPVGSITLIKRTVREKPTARAAARSATVKLHDQRAAFELFRNPGLKSATVHGWPFDHRERHDPRPARVGRRRAAVGRGRAARRWARARPAS